MSFQFAGAGPGVQTRDGCSVELYRRLPYLGELEDYRNLFSPQARVIDLGCGTGRLTRRLLEWGAHVTAVDNCPEMLAALPDGASPVLSDIESLDLDERFDVALLASCLINHPEQQLRRGFIDTARRHLRESGRLLLERHDPAWLRRVQAGPLKSIGDIAMSAEAVRRAGDTVEMTLRYEMPGSLWRQSFAVVPLDEADVESLLAQCGFGSFAWAAHRKRWLIAAAR